VKLVLRIVFARWRAEVFIAGDVFSHLNTNQASQDTWKCHAPLYSQLESLSPASCLAPLACLASWTIDPARSETPCPKKYPCRAW
jgi:hypothetical protein